MVLMEGPSVPQKRPPPEDAILVTGKATEATKPETDPCWAKLDPEFVHNHPGFTIEPLEEITKETPEVAK